MTNLQEITDFRTVARGTGMFMGAAMQYKHLTKDIAFDEEYAKMGAAEYELLTACNACKMPIIAKSWDRFNYTGCDFMRNFSRENKI